MIKITLGNKVVVSDPCYELDTWCAGQLENVLPGEYNCDICKTETDWGNRVSHLYAVHSDYNVQPDEITEEQNFEVGVDSGTAGIFDYEYYAQYHTGHTDDTWYDHKICNAFYPNRCEMGIDIIKTHNKGVASNTGYGDGTYICYVKRNDEGQIIAILIEYISECDCDDYEDEYDENDYYND